MLQHKIVSQSEWTAQRKALLAKEKEFTRARDQLSAERRKLPWVKVDKPYVFDTPDGKKTLAELFDGKSQLVVYHFMLGPGWEEGCPSCSYLADHFDGAIAHLSQRDVAFVVVSRAPLPRSKPSSGAWAGASNGSPHSAATSTSTTTCRFQQNQVGSEGEYNYAKEEIGSDEMPGASVFYKDPTGDRLSHLFRLRPGARHPHRRLQLARSHAQRPRRGRAALVHGLGAPPR